MKFMKRLLAEKREKEEKEAADLKRRIRNGEIPRPIKPKPKMKLRLPPYEAMIAYCEECGGVNQICFGGANCRDPNSSLGPCPVWQNVHAHKIPIALLPVRVNQNACSCVLYPSDFMCGHRASKKTRRPAGYEMAGRSKHTEL